MAADSSRKKDAIEGAASEGGRVVRAPRRKIDLRSLEAINRELRRVYHSVCSGDISPQDGTRMTYMLDVQRKLIEAINAERRQGRRERTVGQGPQPDGVERRAGDGAVQSEEDAKRSALERAKRLGWVLKFPDEPSDGEPGAG